MLNFLGYYFVLVLLIYSFAHSHVTPPSTCSSSLVLTGTSLIPPASSLASFSCVSSYSFFELSLFPQTSKLLPHFNIPSCSLLPANPPPFHYNSTTTTSTTTTSTTETTITETTTTSSTTTATTETTTTETTTTSTTTTATTETTTTTETSPSAISVVA
eukprot:GHVS01057247.1.p1 GENE.GHVS01057247.1~~GHVS01057247.1.p1  ORF type:complete len:159 (-),score=51.61 GHVS01057247.1:6-482(-)